MKKVILLILFLIAVPTSVNAEDNSRVIKHLIDAQIEIAGGMRVRELIIVEGDIDSFTRRINFRHLGTDWDGETADFNNGTIYNGFSLENVRISAFPVTYTIDFELFGGELEFFNELDITNREGNGYTYNTNELGATYNIFTDNEYGRFAFYIEYLVSNVVVIHEDVAEINYIFKNLDIGAEETMIRVLIPFATDDDVYNLWVHCPARTVLNELKNSNDEVAGFIAQTSNMQTELRFRMTLPLEQIMIPLYLNHSGVEGLEEIQRVENDLITAFNFSRRALNTFRYILITLSVIYIICSLVLIKFREKSIFILYGVLGLILMFFNYLFEFHLLWIYLIILAPIIIKIATTIKKK